MKVKIFWGIDREDLESEINEFLKNWNLYASDVKFLSQSGGDDAIVIVMGFEYNS